jgi:hypothetical protein
MIIYFWVLKEKPHKLPTHRYVANTIELEDNAKLLFGLLYKMLQTLVITLVIRKSINGFDKIINFVTWYYHIFYKRK